MKNLGTLLENEIARRVDAALKTQLKPLKAQIKSDQRTIRLLQGELAKLSRRVGRPVTKKAALPSPQGRGARGHWDHRVVEEVRLKHNLSQTSLGALLGVGLNTVWLWEQGRSRPRQGLEDGILELNALSSPAVKRRLSKLGISEGKKRPGRPPSQPAKKAASKKTKAAGKKTKAAGKKTKAVRKKKAKAVKKKVARR